ncbi:MAG: hypothetical protein RLY31_2905 [Bacteroidota bacterium]
MKFVVTLSRASFGQFRLPDDPGKVFQTVHGRVPGFRSGPMAGYDGSSLPGHKTLQYQKQTHCWIALRRVFGASTVSVWNPCIPMVSGVVASGWVAYTVACPDGGRRHGSGFIRRTGCPGCEQRGAFPRMTSAQRDAIASSAEGLMLYNTTTPWLETNL